MNTKFGIGLNFSLVRMYMQKLNPRLFLLFSLNKNIQRWRRGVVVITTVQLHSTSSLNSGSAQVQNLLAVCRRFAMVRISDNGLDWK